MKEKKLTYLVGLAVAIGAGALLAVGTSRPASSCGGPEEIDKIYVVEGDVRKPIRLSGEAPAYPEEARKARAEGTVVVRVVIDREGDVASTEIVEAEREDLGVSAADAISGWTFQPATLEDEPVAVYYHLTVRFRLDGGDDQEPSLR